MSSALTSPAVLAERRLGPRAVRARSTAPRGRRAHASRPARPVLTGPVDATREAITAVARDGSLHGWVEALDLPGRRVDHVVLDGSGVTAISSGWHDSALTQLALTGLAARAAVAAAVTTAVVRERGCEAPVRALLVVWGGAQADVPAGGFVTGGALMLRGADLEAYLSWSADSQDALGLVDAAHLLLALADVPTGDRVVSALR